MVSGPFWGSHGNLDILVGTVGKDAAPKISIPTTQAQKPLLPLLPFKALGVAELT